MSADRTFPGGVESIPVQLRTKQGAALLRAVAGILEHPHVANVEFKGWQLAQALRLFATEIHVPQLPDPGPIGERPPGAFGN